MKRIALFSLISLTSFAACESEKDCNRSERCELESDPGYCKAYFPKYYYDKDEKKCKEFIWGGCGGIVPFDSLEECKQCECGKSANE
jgi:hypothetical protein